LPLKKRKPKKKPRKALGRVLSNDGVARALVEHKGNLSAVGRKFGVTRQAVSKYIADRPVLLQLAGDEREGMVDEAVTSLGKAVRKGEAWAVCFTLKCLGKDRGFVERHELTGAGGGPIKTRSEVNLRLLTDDDLDQLERILDRATPPDNEHVPALPIPISEPDGSTDRESASQPG